MVSPNTEHAITMQELVDNLPGAVGVYEVSKDEALQLCLNDGFYSLLRDTRERRQAALGGDLFKAVHPQDAPLLRAAASDLLGGRETIELTCRVLDGQHNYVWIRALGKAKRDGNRTLVYCSFFDVSEQTDKYRRQLDELNSTSNSTLVSKGLYNLTRNKIQYYHRYADDGVSEAEMSTYDKGLQATAQRFSLDDERARFLHDFNRNRLIQNFFQGKDAATIEYQRKTNDVRTIWTRTDCKLFLEPATGDVICTVFNNDITHQKTTQLMIDAVVSLDYDYLALLDCRTNDYIIYANEGPGRSPLPPFHSSDYEREVTRYAQEHLAPGSAEANIHDMSIENIRTQLANKEFFSSYVDILESDGRTSRKKLCYSYLDRANEQVLITRTDITDIFEREQERLRAMQKAAAAIEQANSAKTEFLSRMSHDLRTPMNAIIGLTELAKNEPNDHEAIMSHLSDINSAGRFLLELVNECLDFEKMSAGKMKLHPAPCSFTRFKHSIEAIVRPLCKKKGIEFRFEDKPYAPVVLVDCTRFEQIFVNLLTNAVKFTPPGGRVEFKASLAQTDESSISCDFVVRDNGCGMSPAFQQKMFEPFEQEHSDLVSESQGTGLGLAIVKSMVDLMGGSISAESSLGKGTAFTVHIDLPLAQADDACDQRIPLKPDALRGKRILVADDQKLNILIARKLLEQKGMLVTCVNNGREALQAFEQSEPGYFDAVLMDIRMPIMNGLEACKAIRVLDRSDAQTLPILATTANVFDEDANEALASGMNEHLSKPIDPERLYRALEGWLCA